MQINHLSLTQKLAKRMRSYKKLCFFLAFAFYFLDSTTLFAQTSELIEAQLSVENDSLSLLGFDLDKLHTEIVALQERITIKKGISKDARKAQKIYLQELLENEDKLTLLYREKRKQTIRLKEMLLLEDEDKQRILYAEYMGKNAVTPNVIVDASVPSTATDAVDQTSIESPSTLDPAKNRRVEDDPYLYPKTWPCHVMTNEIDAFTGSKRIVLQPVPWFIYTPDAIKQYYQNEPYVTASLQLAALDKGKYYLLVDFVIAAENADRLFGQLDKGIFCDIKLFDETNLRLASAQTALPEKQANSRQTIYHIKLMLDKAQIKAIKQSEVELFRINWTSGYEEYPITFINALRDQISCLEAQGL